MSSVRIGALAPLSTPGWFEAGRQLLAGLELGARDINSAGGVAGRPIELAVHDTAGNAEIAIAAVDDLAASGVAAIAGEYHSVVARAVAARCDAQNFPFLCSSAVIDRLTDWPTDWVARMAPPQSRGWRIYAEYLIGAGHRHIAVAAQPSVYWSAGIDILRDCFMACGGDVTVFEANAQSGLEIRDQLANSGATALLLLTSIPDPAISIVKVVRNDHRLANILIGAPAGQAEFAGWMELLGAAGADVPFLRYLPNSLPSLGRQVEVSLHEHLGQPPSFVAFEGYDTMLALAKALEYHCSGIPIAECWPRIAVEGTRGPISFSRWTVCGIWQWSQPPIEVVARDPGIWTRFHVLRSNGSQ
jgi:ABC-type branched-subunit amino acid transport system substrate-binding protein